MTGYPDAWRKSLQERGMKVSRPKTQFMDFIFEHNEQGIRDGYIGRRLLRMDLPGKKTR